MFDSKTSADRPNKNCVPKAILSLAIAGTILLAAGGQYQFGNPMYVINGKYSTDSRYAVSVALDEKIEAAEKKIAANSVKLRDNYQRLTEDGRYLATQYAEMTGIVRGISADLSAANTAAQ